MPEDIALITILGLLGRSAPVDFAALFRSQDEPPTQSKGYDGPARYRQGLWFVGELAAIEDDHGVRE